VWYRFFRALGQVICILFFGHRAYGIRNVPRTGAVIIACNHQSYMDPVVVGIAVERCFTSLARESLFKHWAFGWLLRRLKSVPLDRGSADLGAMRQAMRVLDKGDLLLLFPEGTRSFDGEIGQMQPGLAVLAGRGGAWGVPAAVEGPFKCWPRSRMLPRPGKVMVAYGRPMRYTGRGSQEARAFIEELRERIMKLQAGLRDGSIQAGRKDL
jgi:1-acyl-sn-glycerol-3-phosphate acyltransferase